MSDTRPPSVFSQQSPLIGLGTEAFEIVVFYLSYRDIAALEIIGSKGISSKLARVVTEIDAQIPCLFKWSFLPFRYPKLRSLAINRNKGTKYHPFYAPSHQLIPQDGHRTLESLFVHSTLGLALLHGYALPSKLSKLLPNLKKLEIESDSHFSPTMLRNVPPTVTDFRLTLSADLSDTPFHVSALSTLPKSLTTLHINSNALFECTNYYGASTLISLPPALTDLSLCIQRSSMSIFKSLPSTMRSVVHSGIVEPGSMVKLSDIPKSLTVLHCIIGGTLIVDSPFPGSLTSLIVNSKVRIEGQETELAEIRTLPPSLTLLQFLSHVVHDMTQASLLPSLSSFIINAPSDDFSNMRSLTSLTFSYGLDCDGMISSLPVTLTHLAATPGRAPEWIETVLKLTNLKSLHLHSSPEPCLEVFWELLRSRLETLHCCPGHFNSVEELNGNWEKLKDLTLEVSGEMPPELQLWTPDEGPSPICYPPTLETLNIIGLTYLPIFWTPVTLLPSLRFLKLLSFQESPFDEANKVAMQETIAALPSTLTDLVVTFPCFIESRWLQSLPSGLRHLRFLSMTQAFEFPFVLNADPSAAAVCYGWISDIPYGELWTEDHLIGLPPRLETLHLDVNRMFNPNSDSHLWLPPRLIISPTMLLSTKASLEADRQLSL